MFLPNVEFKALFHCEGVTEQTRTAIWKYLQLVLVTILGSVKNKMDFGDTAGLFEGVDEAALQEKLAETISGIGDFFKNIGLDDTDMNTDIDPEKMGDMFEKMQKEMENMMDKEQGQQEGDTDFNMGSSDSNVPNAEQLHEHLKGLFDGKIGSLAKELAEEISGDMQNMFQEEGGAEIKSTQDLLKKMMRNPKKIMDIMKTIGGKITQKMKTGEISEEDIMKEAGEFMSKMKNMGGKGGSAQFTEMFKNLTKTMGGGAKFNTGAFQKMERKMAAKERMIQKLQEKQEKRGHIEKKEEGKFVFKVDDEVQEKSSRPIKFDEPKVLNDEEIIAMFNEKTAATPASAGKKKNRKNKK
jgi:hypothetical protein